jgi:hypothetical protein
MAETHSRWVHKPFGRYGVPIERTIERLAPDVPKPRTPEPAYGFHLLEVGDAMTLNRPDQVVRSAIWRYRQKPGNKNQCYAVRKIDGKRCKVWRTA